MAEPRTAREIAETIILSHTEDIEWGSIGDMTGEEFNALGEEAHEALCHEVDALISLATVTVTFPGDPATDAAAALALAHEALKYADQYCPDLENHGSDMADQCETCGQAAAVRSALAAIAALDGRKPESEAE